MTDREQTRRDAETFIAATPNTDWNWLVSSGQRLALGCLALLTELEQAEREYEDCETNRRWQQERASKAEARLAKVPALASLFLDAVIDRPDREQLIAAWNEKADPDAMIVTRGDAFAARENER